MFHNLNSLLAQATAERLMLLVNHLLAAEPVATERMRKHAGRFMQLHFLGWPAWLPALPSATFLITPAGLLEWCAEDPERVADLRVSVDASNPVLAMGQALAGTRPRVEVSGDAALATDLNWLFDNLRWDMQDDLARVVGEAPAREIARIAGGVATGVREAARTVGGWVARGRDGSASSPK